MKTTIVITTLLALASPAFAAKAKPQDFPAIRKWAALNEQCYYSIFPDNDLDVEISKEDYVKTARGKVCLAAEALGKQLIARGYCLYGHGVVGKTGGRVKSAYWEGQYRTRCYEITNVPRTE
jgi:hypothetical protein